jgi:hypothetical protein
LIQYVHVLARNPNLAVVNRHLSQSLCSLPPRLVAKYLFDYYRSFGPHEILVRSTRHPACSVEVVKEIERLWLQDVEPPRISLTCSELPRRLFRSTLPNPRQLVHPLIKHLFDVYNPSANSHKGYPLCRAVLTSDHALVAYLLARGADPAMKDGIAVQIAIQAHDLKSVRLLVERKDDRTSETGRQVRRRISDRITITPNLVECALSKGSQDIVEYFVKEKGKFAAYSADVKVSCRVSTPL